MEFTIKGDPEIRFEVDDLWWTEAKLDHWMPTAHYRCCTNPDLMILDLVEIEPRFRARGFNKRRFPRILRGYRKASEIPPIEVMKLNNGGKYKYKLIDGYHRFYSSVAAGFSHIPAIKSKL